MAREKCLMCFELTLKTYACKIILLFCIVSFYSPVDYIFKYLIVCHNNFSIIFISLYGYFNIDTPRG